MPLIKGDFILLNYTAKIKETGDIFDTTFEEIAKKEQLYKEGEIYEPKLIVIGEGWVLKPLDESLLSMKLRKSQIVEISPEKAFGQRDPEKVKRVPLKHLTSKGKIEKQKHKLTLILKFGSDFHLSSFSVVT